MKNRLHWEHLRCFRQPKWLLNLFKKTIIAHSSESPTCPLSSRQLAVSLCFAFVWLAAHTVTARAETELYRRRRVMNDVMTKLTAEPEQQASFLAAHSLLTSCPQSGGILCWSCHKKATRLFGCVLEYKHSCEPTQYHWMSFYEVLHFIPQNLSSLYSNIDSKGGYWVLCNCRSHMAWWLMDQLSFQSYTQLVPL